MKKTKNKKQSEKTVTLPLRIPAHLKEKIQRLAEKEHRSVNNMTELLLYVGLDHIGCTNCEDQK